jgi:hypothetical protein
MDKMTRRTLALWPDAPTTPLDALRHTIAIGHDIADADMAVMVTSGVYGPGVRTGLTWGDLRALASLIDTEEQPHSPEPEPPATPATPATVRFHNGTTAVLDGWSLTEFGATYYGDVYTQFSGWIDRKDPETPVVGAAQILHADLPGRDPIVEQDVNVEVTGYGGPRKYMKLRWRSGYDRAADQRINPA